jgi:DNA-binding SARP family transcriptional activator
VLHAGRPVTADALIDLLWGDDAPAAAAATLRTYVAHLRRALEPDRAEARVLVTTPQGYRLEVPPGSVDADRFTAIVAAPNGPSWMPAWTSP